MTIQSSFREISIVPPVIRDYNEPGAFVAALRSPWFELIADLHDIVLQVTVSYAASHGVKALYLPLTTRTITCPSGLGSDSMPVNVTVNGVEAYLADSMQFALEYGCRIARGGCYNIMPSFRSDIPDKTHLGQFTHSETEIIGSLDTLIFYVEGYIKTLAAEILNRLEVRLANARGDVSHLHRMAARQSRFEQITFDDAARLLGDENGAVKRGDSGRSLTRKGELLLMKRVGEVFWIRHFDSLSVPFYQAFHDDNQNIAKNADMYFGMGEVVGSGERHLSADELRKSMSMHGVSESEYEWYIRMHDEFPIQTSGFGMGVERFLMWVLNHDDVRDMALVSRLGESDSWPAAVVRP